MLAALLGCRAHLSAVGDVPASTAEPTFIGSGGPGPAVVVLPQGSAELLRVSLWIDAGSRDADPPQAATLAAWVAAEAAGRGVESWVYPEATEFAASCPKPQLSDCMQRLARALAHRSASTDALLRARARLVELRRAADAADALRSTDRLALQALYGDGAAALFPLGEAGQDERANAERVVRVLQQHFAPGRALLVVAGDVAAERVLADAKANFAASADRPAPRAASRPHPRAEGGVQLEVGNHAALSVALTASELSRAQAGADGLREVLERGQLATQRRAHVFPLRGESVALLRFQTRDPLATVTAAAQQLERWRGEGLQQAPARSPEQDSAARSRRVGLRWAAGVLASDLGLRAAKTIPTANSDLALGVGVTAPAARSDRVASSDPDARQREQWQARADAAWEAGRTRAELHGDGEHDTHAAAVELDNGARVLLRRQPGEQVAIAVRFACGGRCDPPLLHGRAALLATLTATACAGLSPQQLLDRLKALGAELRPRADGESWGILLTAPAASWREALGLSLECALHPMLERAQLGNARLVLRQRFGARGGPGETRARVAQALLPSAPGLIAPWGDLARVDSVGLNVLREFWEAYRVGSAVSVAAVGPIEVDDALGRSARRLAGLAKGHAPRAARIEAGPGKEQASDGADRTWGVAVWRLPAERGDAAGARAFATTMRALLARVPGWAPSWHDGGADSEIGAWAAVALSGPPSAAGERGAELKRHVERLAKEQLAAVADRAFELERRERAQRAGSAADEAETLARTPFSSAAPEPSRDGARRVALALSAAPPVWLPLP